MSTDVLTSLSVLTAVAARTGRLALASGARGDSCEC